MEDPLLHSMTAYHEPFIFSTEQRAGLFDRGIARFQIARAIFAGFGGNSCKLKRAGKPYRSVSYFSTAWKYSEKTVARLAPYSFQCFADG